MVDEINEPSTPEPVKVPKDKKDRKKLAMMLLTVLLVVALGAAGWLYWQLSQKKTELSKKSSLITSLQKKVAESDNKTSTKDKTSTNSGTDDLPVVVFSPGGLFSDSEKTQITTKMINPYKAWHRDQSDSVVSIHVQQNSSISGSQYSVDAIYRNGVYEGFLYGTIDATSQDWWTPTCLDACTFSASFRATYPEVVAASAR